VLIPLIVIFTPWSYEMAKLTLYLFS
jgi:hypothetical protein